ncbi:MAG: hypothetical protein OEM59_17425 [Rhodospirillales bacterium]|nr:hypothetical protein [Rhodospirillales bacterium]
MGDVVRLEEYRKRRLGEQARRARAKPGGAKRIVSPGVSPGVSQDVSKAQKPPVKEPAERKTEAADDQPKS